MMIGEVYTWARKESHYSLILLIEFLIYEKQVLKETDDESKLTYYLQDKFHTKMNEHLANYEVKRKNAN